VESTGIWHSLGDEETGRTWNRKSGQGEENEQRCVAPRSAVGVRDRRQYPSHRHARQFPAPARWGDYMSGWCKCTKKAKSESTYDSAKKESMSAEGLCGEEAGGWDGLVSLHRRSAFIVIVGAYILFLCHRPLWLHPNRTTPPRCKTKIA